VPEDTRARLLRAALEVFARVGYQSATVREICARAGSNIALVNYHFGDKMGLYSEVLRGMGKAMHFRALQDALDRDVAPEQILRDLIHTRLGALRGDMAEFQYRIMIHELNQPTPAMTRHIAEVSRPLYQRLLELTGRIIGLPAGDETTRLCAHSVMGQILFYVFASPSLCRIWPELKPPPDQLDRIADHIADFSLAYLRQVKARQAGKTTPQKRSKRK
jgi:AcrR family transcriptional regulator